MISISPDLLSLIDNYQCASKAGERRWRACNMAGLKEVPVIIREANDQQVAELALLENIQREDLTVLAKVLTPAAQVNIERIDDMIMHLNKIKRALMQSDSTKQVVQMKIAV